MHGRGHIKVRNVFRKAKRADKTPPPPSKPPSPPPPPPHHHVHYLDFGECGGGEGDDRDPRQRGAHFAEALVLPPEVMAPGRHAVGLVDGHKTNAPLKQEPSKKN